MFSLLRTKISKRKTVVVGLKSENPGKEMLLRLLELMVERGDKVLTVHVQLSDDAFDPNSFHIHEDFCKLKAVDFQVKVCVNISYVSELAHQVRINHATILALGCWSQGPKNAVIASLVKQLPPTCWLVVMDARGIIHIQKRGTSQDGSLSAFKSTQSLSSQNSTVGRVTASTDTEDLPDLISSSNLPVVGHHCFEDCPSISPQAELSLIPIAHKMITAFSPGELETATRMFHPAMLIGVGGSSIIYRAHLVDGREVAVKVLRSISDCPVDLFREVDILTSIRHENIVQIIGYCYGQGVEAIVCDLLEGSLRQKLRQLPWSSRMEIAIGVAKALEYLHHSCDPPIIHRDVKSSNILLTADFLPQIADFGVAMRLPDCRELLTNRKPFKVVGTFGYLAPEYIMYGKVDEKTDVYSYGVVLLELITGKDAIRADDENRESIVIWARSLFKRGRGDMLIDVNLHGEYKQEEMDRLILAARLCLTSSSSRRPTMQTVLKLLQEPEYCSYEQEEENASHVEEEICQEDDVDEQTSD
ncbi:hypothetical protein MLD38_023115 [Melastoma candidum]|uniref:Uncharacterized protein n=1 Tax=Melastoma candidum TaxID=119954 RepID=A0ACB9QPY4_9MYRT|nr:hypothetical protein MLD38_023115 [Melastoma candidum]